MSKISYDGPGELHITDINEAYEMSKDDLDRVITVCQDSVEDNVPDSVEYSFYCMSDGPANGYGGDHSYEMFAEAADELNEALTNDKTVLIHCHQGTSRSVSVATAAIGRLLEEPRSDAIDLIHHYRPRENYPDRLLMEHASHYISEHTEHQKPFSWYEHP